MYIYRIVSILSMNVLNYRFLHSCLKSEGIKVLLMPMCLPVQSFVICFKIIVEIKLLFKQFLITITHCYWLDFLQICIQYAYFAYFRNHGHFSFWKLGMQGVFLVTKSIFCGNISTDEYLAVSKTDIWGTVFNPKLNPLNIFYSA